MEIRIRNFLGVVEADIPLTSTPVVVTGHNASGKTSLARAIGGLLSRNANPLGLASTKRRYVHDSAEDGDVALIDDAGNQVRWWRLLETGIRELPDAPKGIIQHALGLTNFVEIPPKYRVEVWESCFLPAPRVLVELVSAQLRKEIARSAVVDEVISMLRTKSWQDAEAVFKQKLTEAKREWSTISGESYGVKKADHWSPLGWRSELDAMTPAEGSTRLEECREALRGVQIREAVRESDIDRAAKYAAEVPNIEKEIATLSDTRTAAKEAHTAVEREAQAVTENGLKLRDELARHDKAQPVLEDTTPCPACGEALVIGPQNSLTRARDKSAFEAMLRAWSMGREKLEVQLKHLRGVSQELQALRLRPAKDAASRCDAALADARSRLSVSKREAAVATNGRVVTDEDTRKVAEAEQAIEDSRVCLTLINQKFSAHNAHMNAVNYGAIAYALGPNGIRARAMKEKLEHLTEVLAEVQEITGWPKVELDAAYAVTIANRPGAVCASSEQWRANFVLQAAIALVLGEQRVLADGADILHGECQRQFIDLVDWLADRQIYGIVTATGSLDHVPAGWHTVAIVDGRGVRE